MQHPTRLQKPFSSVIASHFVILLLLFATPPHALRYPVIDFPRLPLAGNYHKIVIALTETIRLMGEVDAVIEKHGGWPGAFSGAESAD